MQGIKYTEEFVIGFYKQYGCKLSEPYSNAATSLRYRCKCGNESRKNFFNFMQSPYCRNCAAVKQAHSQEFIQNIFKERGCELLDLYNNNWTRMKFKCKCGEISTTTFASFYDKGCYCENCGGTKKLTIEKIKEKIKEANYTVISNEYARARTKLKLKCDKDHDCEISWNNFQRGKRCKTCFIETRWNKPEDRKFIKLCRSLLQNCLKRIKVKKTNKTTEMLGYNGIQLKEHIIAHPNWNNVKDKIWHLDHIFPFKAFCDYNLKDIKLINCLENLRPMLGKENLSKGAKYSKEEFESWLKSKNISA